VTNASDTAISARQRIVVDDFKLAAIFDLPMVLGVEPRKALVRVAPSGCLTESAVAYTRRAAL
jgi:hypothetical protein